MADLNALRTEFIERFAAEPRFYHAPGRVNLIGEHTDYNAGFVMPAAIRFYTTVAVAGRADRRLRVRSTNFDETLEIALPEAADAVALRDQSKHWIGYVAGVAWSLQQQGVALSGADLLIHGEVPLGAGLSSSAALEVSVGLALSELAGHRLDNVTLAKLCQRAVAAHPEQHFAVRAIDLVAHRARCGRCAPLRGTARQRGRRATSTHQQQH